MLNVRASVSRYPMVVRGLVPAGSVPAAIALIDEMMSVPDVRRPEYMFRLASEIHGLGRADLVERLFGLFQRSQLRAMAGEVLGGDLVFLLQHCIVRRYEQRPDLSGSPWHVDAEFLGFKHPVLNFWTPLVDVGERNPGLTFPSDPGVSFSAFRDWYANIEPDAGYVSERDKGRRLLASALATTGVVSPVLKAGDALLFDQVVPHRTQALDGRPDVRHSIEIRVAGRGRLPTMYEDSERPVAVVSEGDDGTAVTVRVGLARELAA